MRLVLILTLMSQPALAGEWQILDEAGIAHALAARVLAYPDGATQNFFSDGRTLYAVATGESWGKWWAEGGQYCSTWPPSNMPASYVVAAMGKQIRFTSARGDETVGRYVDLN